MHERLQSLVEGTQKIDSQAGLMKFLRHVRRVYDLDNAIYYALSLGGEKPGEEFGAMTYPMAWHERYEDVRYRDCDPVVIASTTSFAPIDWRTLDWSGRPLKRLLAEAREFRVGNHGYTIPLHGPQGQFAMFSFSKQCTPEQWAVLIAETAGELMLVAHHVHRQVLDLTGAEGARTIKSLSPREKDALTLIATGRSRGQVAEKLEISESTLRVYLDSARHKLGGLNTFHAIAIAMKNRAIHV